MCFCTATDTGSTSAALCIFDGDIAFNTYVAKAASTAANTGTFFAARRFINGSIAFNAYSNIAINATADASTTVAAHTFIDLGIVLNGYIAGALAPTANTSSIRAASCFANCGISFNDYADFALKAATDASSESAADRLFDNGVTSNGNCGITAPTTSADASAANSTRSRVATASGSDGSARNNDIRVTALVTATNTCTTIATCSVNGAAGDFKLTGIFEISAANTRAARTSVCGQ